MYSTINPIKSFIYLAVLFVFTIAFLYLTSFARAEEGDDIDNEAPAFNSPAQAQRAENLSALTASEPDQEAIEALEEAEAKAQDLAEAKETLERLKSDPNATPEQIAAAEAAVQAAQDAFEQAQAVADEKMAAFAGVPVKEIAEMRAGGMGWGQIAHELGVHPGALGLGHIKGFQASQADEVKAATERNLKTGWTKGHGAAASGKSSGKAFGLGKVATKAGQKGKDKAGYDDHGSGKSGGNK